TQFDLRASSNICKRSTMASQTGDKALHNEMLRLQGLGFNTPSGVPYTDDKIMVIVCGASSEGTFLVLVGFYRDRARSFCPRLHARTPSMSLSLKRARSY
nr:hypothetical protein [Tanacetum cinerariifolium]